jgi:hypothetical protein
MLSPHARRQPGDRQLPNGSSACGPGGPCGPWGPWGTCRRLARAHRRFQPCHRLSTSARQFTLLLGCVLAASNPPNARPAPPRPHARTPAQPVPARCCSRFPLACSLSPLSSSLDTRSTPSAPSLVCSPIHHHPCRLSSILASTNSSSAGFHTLRARVCFVRFVLGALVVVCVFCVFCCFCWYPRLLPACPYQAARDSGSLAGYRSKLAQLPRLRTGLLNCELRFVIECLCCWSRALRSLLWRLLSGHSHLPPPAPPHKRVN